MKTRSGEQISIKEFFKRWKEGVANMTPLQQLKSVQMGYWIVILGMVWGVIYGIIKQFWWLTIIMVGALIIQLFGILSNSQKIRLLKSLEMPADEKREVNYIQ